MISSTKNTLIDTVKHTVSVSVFFCSEEKEVLAVVYHLKVGTVFAFNYMGARSGGSYGDGYPVSAHR